jgi:hypothetical protein
VASELVIKGEPELHAALSKLGGNLRDMTSLNGQVADELARAIGSAAPRLTGTLAGSFHGKGSKDTAEVTSELVYAPVIENGWAAHNIEARHYAESTLTQSEGTIQKRYEEGVGQMCKKAES